ncbi:MAG: HlyD family efflux transporter periplasmic adaptor subunit [Pelistega sp.]|nr:HlyD family efflux transporter periplasmic adaptor subunit [Pelistega sp.]
MKFIKWLFFIALVGSLGFLAYWFNRVEPLPAGFVSANGRLELNRIDVASLYPGRVQEIKVREGEAVKKDQVLVVLSSEQSQSQLSAAKAAKLRVEETVARTEAEIQAREQQLKLAQMELNNAVALRRDNLVSQAEVNRRQAARDAERAGVAAAQAAQAEAQAGVAQAQAQVDAASSAHTDLLITAPLEARVEYRIAELGNVIASGSRVVTLVDPLDITMNVFLPTHSMAAIELGAEARIILDGIDAVWPAQVEFVSAQAQFTPKHVETANEREKLMYKVKLRLPLEVAQAHSKLLKGGLTGIAYVRLDPSASWPDIWQVRLPNSIRSGASTISAMDTELSLAMRGTHTSNADTLDTDTIHADAINANAVNTKSLDANTVKLDVIKAKTVGHVDPTLSVSRQ